MVSDRNSHCDCVASPEDLTLNYNVETSNSLNVRGDNLEELATNEAGTNGTTGTLRERSAKPWKQIHVNLRHQSNIH